MTPNEETALSRDFFDNHAAHWDEEETESTQHRLQEIFKALPFPLRANILDAGCGTGVLLPVLNQNADPRSMIMEFDVSQQMLEQNRQRRDIYGMQVKYVQGDAHALPFATAFFDCVILFAVYPHFHDPEIAMKEVFRVLKPGGHALLLHLMSSAELNHMHSQISGPVSRDRIPPLPQLLPHMKMFGFIIKKAVEQPGLYQVVLQRPA